MKSNTLTIVINKPVEEVFTFILDPANTAKWVSSIETEETNEWPVKVGSIYRNSGKDGIWSQFELTELSTNTLFTLVSYPDKDFFVRYQLKALADNSTEFKYDEWVETGALDDPFTLEGLTELKTVLET
jgi:uncharacterized protein YndB with AHSA1/START domain